VHPTRKLEAVVPRKPSEPPPTHRLLLVEDDVHLASALTRRLQSRFDVTAVADGATAAELLVREKFDVVLTDIQLPRMSGIDLLRVVRAYDLDVPVIVMTGAPSVETAIAAIDLGALTYIAKPFEGTKLEEALDRASKLVQIARAKRELADSTGTGSPLAGDRAGLEACFTRALDGLWLAFQPIVDARSHRTIAYEALARTTEPTMPHPGAFIEAAERLGRLHDFSRRVRTVAAESFRPPDATAKLFINLHPRDLVDPDLYDRNAPLSKMASRVVCEITERAALESVQDVRSRTTALRALGFELAVDDLGAGYAGLTSFATLEPDVVKLDMSLVRNIDVSPVRSRIVESIVRLSRELSMRVVAEGIESQGELGRCVAIGCDYLLGFLLGLPRFDARASSLRW
jgi:EAL domain-containing protein (putative c-di-GMP-specific phosphodiesterase class I)